MGESLIERSIFRARQPFNNDLPASLRGSPDDHLKILDFAKKIMPVVVNNPKLLERSRPTLWHTDLHMGNIFVSEQNPEKVAGFIDWQNTSVYPLFLQARFPVFLTPPEDYPKGLVMPKLPPDFEQMDTQDKELALYSKSKATWTKAYEVATFLNNRESWKAMQVHGAFKELFRRCGETWEEGLVPLRETMMEILREQESLGLSALVSFTEKEVSEHKQAFAFYQEWHEMRSFVKEMLDTDDEGWVAPERDFDEVETRNKMLLELYISRDSTRSADEIKMMWPFPPHA